MSQNRGTFGSYLRQQLDRLGWTAADLARRGNLPESSIGRWLRDVVAPRPDNVREIAAAINRPVLEVLIATGFLGSDEVMPIEVVGAATETLSDEELLAEVARRVKAGRAILPDQAERDADPGRFVPLTTTSKKGRRTEKA